MPIQILSTRLANQIAAGEVVERPASVVKELVENSLDSGANLIEIDIEKGGHKRIFIRDNGSGIGKEELALALSRHATSKITELDDLEAINSLGFRGEALASISSVARLTLSSKPEKQSQAWQAHCAGRDMQVALNPVAHPDGTSVDVVDLFFNTPARRKFLKTEKTEFAHIDEVLRRIALSRFDVGFSIKHNGKLLRKYPAAQSKVQRIKRLATICGKETTAGAIELNSQYQELTLKGWLVTPEQANVKADFQYFYVNGRMMRDKLLNHAVRQAFEERVGTDIFPSYVLYLILPPNQVDVNVHPAKHEVRFHQARLVHDFVYRALHDALNQYFDSNVSDIPTAQVTILPQTEPKHEYIQPLRTQVPQPSIHEPPAVHSTPAHQTHAPRSNGTLPRQVDRAVVTQQTGKNYQQLMTPNPGFESSSSIISQTSIAHGQWLDVSDSNILVNVQKHFYLVAKSTLLLDFLMRSFADKIPVSQPLLMPISITATASLLAQAKLLYQPLLDNSLEIGWTPNRVILRKVPAGLRQFRWIDSFEDILSCKNSQTQKVCEHLLTCVANKTQMDNEQTQGYWLQWLSQTANPAENIKRIGKRVDLSAWLHTHE